MEDKLRHLCTAVVRAVGILRQEADPADARAQYADAVLRTALWHIGYNPKGFRPRVAELEIAAPRAHTDDDADSLDLARPTPRSLADYRQEREMTIPQFTTYLGLLHREYVDVVHRLPVDRRVRDQIAFRLGVPWTMIAEFMPEQLRPARPRPEPLPAPEGAEPPREPWFLVDEESGEVISGPHTEPVPANAVFPNDLIVGGPTNLVALFDEPLTEEEWLPPGGFTRDERRTMYDEDAMDVEEADAVRREALAELARVGGHAQML
jgi:hypothetical protein